MLLNYVQNLQVHRILEFLLNSALSTEFNTESRDVFGDVNSKLAYKLCLKKYVVLYFGEKEKGITIHINCNVLS